MSEQLEKALIHLEWMIECGCEFEYSATKASICYGVDREELVRLFYGKS